jgi:hypothetical protein
VAFCPSLTLRAVGHHARHLSLQLLISSINRFRAACCVLRALQAKIFHTPTFFADRAV